MHETQHPRLEHVVVWPGLFHTGLYGRIGLWQLYALRSLGIRCHLLVRHLYMNACADLSISALMTGQKMIYYLLFIGFSAACNIKADLGLWEVQYGDTAWHAAEVLGDNPQNLTKIERLNPGINLDILKRGDILTVPYVESVPAPATWTTSDCTRMLDLRYIPGTTTPIIPESTTTAAVKKTVTSSKHTKTRMVDPTDSPLTTFETKQSSLHTTPGGDPTSVPGPRESSKGPDTNPHQHCLEWDRMHRAIDDFQQRSASEFCGSHLNTTMDQNSDSILGLYEGDGSVWTNKALAYQYSISFDEQCEKTDTQTVGDTCEPRMRDNFKLCDNYGQGAYITEGCLIFGYRVSVVQNITA